MARWAMNGVPEPLEHLILTLLGSEAPIDPSAEADGVFIGPHGVEDPLSAPLLSLIRRLHQSRIPVILLAYGPTDGQVVDALEAGAREVLDASGSASIFTARLRRAVRDQAPTDLARQAEEVEAFISAASHSMKGPIRAIERYSSMILEEKGQLDADTRHMIARMELNAKRLDGLVGDLVRVVQVGQLDLREEECPLREILVVATRHQADLIQDTEATVTMGAPLPTLSGDFDRLVDLFENLVNNALKYRRDGVPPRLEITTQPVHSGAHIVVRDNGQGIPKDDLGRAFGLFYRGNAPHGVEGTGLGLAVVRRIIERHDGRIWLESVEGEGTTVHITLPEERVIPAG